MPVLSIRGLTKSFDEKRVLSGVHLDVEPGEVVGLVGANGAGKTTLMNALAGFIPFDDGQLILDGDNYSPADPQGAIDAGVGIVEQIIRVDPKLMVAQAVFRQTEHARRPMVELLPRAKRLLKQAKLSIDPRTRIDELTRQELGLVEAARLLADDSRVVLLDEVGATFNLAELDELHAITSMLTADGRGVIYISHRLQELIDISHRVAVLRDGVIARVLDARSVTADDVARAMFDDWVPSERAVTGTASDTPVASDSPAPMVHRTRPFEGGGQSALTISGFVGGPLKGFDLTASQGEIVGLIGPRGGGTDDVLFALTGDRPCDEGTVTVGDTTLHISSPRDAAKLRIAYFSEALEPMGVSRDTRLARALASGDDTNDEEFALEVEGLASMLAALAAFDTTASDLLGRQPVSSPGQRRRMELGRFLGQDAAVLLLHEPTQGLDVRARQEVAAIVREVVDGGRCVIVVSSDAQDLLEWCDRIVVVAGGRARAALYPAETSLASLRHLSTGKG